MPKYIGPKCKLARREKIDLELKSGISSLAKKCDMSKIPGEHGMARLGRGGSYSLQLRTKQKLKRIYGMREKQFKKTYQIAKKTKGDTSVNLVLRLEQRLDNVVYRMGFAHTRAHARQIINHKGISLNQKTCNIPSVLVKQGDKIALNSKNREHLYILDAISRAKSKPILPWIIVDFDLFEGILAEMPERKHILHDINEQLVVELYSGKK